MCNSMTSQKRYRHQENSNTGHRTRDIPPRFKRQKSTSNTEPLATRSTSPPSSQLTNNVSAETMTKISFPHRATAAAQGGSINVPQRGLVYSVLPTDIVNTSVAQPMYAPPVWPVGGVPAQSVVVNPVMIPQNHVPYLATNMYNNENCAPSPSYYVASQQAGPISPWNTSGYASPPYQSSCSSPAPSASSPMPEEARTSHSADQMVGKPNNSYLDSDYRTIEMLRELERVADEKEAQEEQDGGGDRKSLVSHHLRMLMCAVDRYTEGIEDELGTRNSRNDDGLSAYGSNKSSPSVSPTPGQQQCIPGTERPMHKNMQTACYAQDVQRQQMWTGSYASESKPAHWQRPRPVLGAGSSGAPSTSTLPRPQQAFATTDVPSTPQPKPVPRSPWVQPPQAFQQMQPTPWNIWSSPSFDFCGVLGGPQYPDCNNSSQLFDSYHNACFPAAHKERKPLYKR